MKTNNLLLLAGVGAALLLLKRKKASAQHPIPQVDLNDPKTRESLYESYLFNIENGQLPPDVDFETWIHQLDF